MPTQFVDDTLVVEYVASTCWPGVYVVLSRVRASPDAAQTVVSVGASSAIAATSSTASELHRETDLMRSLQTSRRRHPARDCAQLHISWRVGQMNASAHEGEQPLDHLRRVPAPGPDQPRARRAQLRQDADRALDVGVAHIAEDAAEQQQVRGHRRVQLGEQRGHPAGCLRVGGEHLDQVAPVTRARAHHAQRPAGVPVQERTDPALHRTQPPRQHRPLLLVLRVPLHPVRPRHATDRTTGRRQTGVTPSGSRPGAPTRPPRRLSTSAAPCHRAGTARPRTPLAPPARSRPRARRRPRHHRRPAAPPRPAAWSPPHAVRRPARPVVPARPPRPSTPAPPPRRTTTGAPACSPRTPTRATWRRSSPTARGWPGTGCARRSTAPPGRPRPRSASPPPARPAPPSARPVRRPAAAAVPGPGRDCRPPPRDRSWTRRSPAPRRTNPSRPSAAPAPPARSAARRSHACPRPRPARAPRPRGPPKRTRQHP